MKSLQKFSITFSFSFKNLSVKNSLNNICKSETKMYNYQNICNIFFVNFFDRLFLMQTIAILSKKRNKCLLF